jgi:hypothetical protein
MDASTFCVVVVEGIFLSCYFWAVDEKFFGAEKFEFLFGYGFYHLNLQDSWVYSSATTIHT